MNATRGRVARPRLPTVAAAAWTAVGVCSRCPPCRQGPIGDGLLGVGRAMVVLGTGGAADRRHRSPPAVSNTQLVRRSWCRSSSASWSRPATSTSSPPARARSASGHGRSAYNPQTLARRLRGMFLWSWLVYWLIVGAWQAYHYYQRYLSSELRMDRLERQFTEARLNALRMQLDPHFLFNALNTISSQVERDPRLARSMIEHLGNLLRLSLEIERRRRFRWPKRWRFSTTTWPSSGSASATPEGRDPDRA